MGQRNYRILQLSSDIWVWELQEQLSSEKLQEITATLGYMGLRSYGDYSYTRMYGSEKLHEGTAILWETTGDYSYTRLYGSEKLEEVRAILACMGQHEVTAILGYMGLRNYRRLQLSSDTWVWETTGGYSYPRIYGSEKSQEGTAILGYMGLRNYRRLQPHSDIWVWETTWGYSYPRMYWSETLQKVKAILGSMGLRKHRRIPLSSERCVWEL